MAPASRELLRIANSIERATPSLNPGSEAAGVQLTSYRASEGSLMARGSACMARQDPRQRLILFLAADVSDIAVLFIAILEEDRTVEVLIVIVVRLG